MAKNPHLALENRYRICREYTELWQQYFQFFADDLEETQITEEMESEFANLMNVLALNHYKFTELCGQFMKDPMDVVAILSMSDSLQTIKTMSEASRQKLMVKWHTMFLEMNKALGKILSRMTPKELEAIQAEAAAMAAPSQEMPQQ